MYPQTAKETEEAKSLTLTKLLSTFPQYGLELQEKVFSMSQNERSEYRCSVCNKCYKTREDVSIDYKIPLKDGGLTEIDNLCVVCNVCIRNK